MIGLFLSSLVSGLIGAIVLNLIDKFISKKLKEERGQQIIAKKNVIMSTQQAQIVVAENRRKVLKETVISDISDNHAQAKEVMRQSINEIFNEDKAIDCKNRNNISDNQSDLAKMQNDLEDLL